MIYTCNVCNKPFKAPPCQKARFCNRDCYNKSREGIFKCDECGKTFTYYKSHKKGKHVFCSVNCHKIFQARDPKNRPKWKGGITNHSGYVMIYSPDHPYATGCYVREHRYVMEKHLGRFLENHEIVHHKNHNKTDNRIENLELTSRATHASMHKENSPFVVGHKSFPRPKYGGK